MNKSSSALKSMVPSLLILAAGLVLGLAGFIPKFQASAGDMINFSQMYVCIVVAVIIAFCFGAVRYNLAVGINLAVISLHDVLLSLAVTALLSLALPQAAIMPVLVLFVPVFTFTLSLPVIREARDLRSANSARDMEDAQIAAQATKSTSSLRLGSAVLALLFIAAAAVCGFKLATALAPLLIGLAVALYSSSLLTAKTWLCSNARFAKSSRSRKK